MQVPQRLYTLDELKLNGIEAAALLSPVDKTLGSIERNLQLVAAFGGIAVWNVFGFGPQQILYLSLALFFLFTLDSVNSFNLWYPFDSILSPSLVKYSDTLATFHNRSAFKLLLTSKFVLGSQITVE